MNVRRLFFYIVIVIGIIYLPYNTCAQFFFKPKYANDSTGLGVSLLISKKFDHLFVRIDNKTNDTIIFPRHSVQLSPYAKKWHSQKIFVYMHSKFITHDPWVTAMYQWYGNDYGRDDVEPIEFQQLKDTLPPSHRLLLPITWLDSTSFYWDAFVGEVFLLYKKKNNRGGRFFYGITPILNLDSLRAARQAAQNMPLVAVPVDKNKMAKGLGQVTFRPHAQGRYAFDWGTWEWYRRSVKLDPYYTPFAPNYIAPWKLVPCGETDYVTACFEGDYKKIDVNKIRFATAPDGDALEAVYDPKILGWRISLHATEHGHTYNIYALYKGQVIGKLRVVSYRAQHHTVTIVPVNNAQPDTAAIERYLNRVYGPVGVRFTVHLDERMRGNVSWSAAGDGRLSLVGLDLFGNEAERRESPDMRRLQAAYAQAVGGLPAGSGCYLFVLDGESGLDPTAHLLGEMPRRSRFGYLFSPDGRGMERTIAHELGHGLFTLQHTFDPEYGGPASRGTTRNLMDYGTDADTALAAFQWNIMASPAVFTLLDDGDAGKAFYRVDIREWLRQVRFCKNHKFSLKIQKNQSGRIEPDYAFFKHRFQKHVFLYFSEDKTLTIDDASITKSEKYLSAYQQNGYQIQIAGIATINCLSSVDRDIIYDYLTAQNPKAFHTELISISGIEYNYSLMYKELENIKVRLIREDKYNTLSDNEKIILELPLIMWSKQWFYGSIFMYNWIVEGGDIVMDDKMFKFIDAWPELQVKEKLFKEFIKRKLNNKITKAIEESTFKLYALSDIRGTIAENNSDEMKIDTSFMTHLTNFSNYSLKASDADDANTPYMAAFGSFTKKFLFTGVAYKSKQEIAVDGIWEYFNDGFDFVDDGVKAHIYSQPLGNWHRSIFCADIEVGKAPDVSNDHLYLQNKHFNSFRDKTGIGLEFNITGKRMHPDKFIKSIKFHDDGVEYK